MLTNDFANPFHLISDATSHQSLNHPIEPRTGPIQQGGSLGHLSPHLGTSPWSSNLTLFGRDVLQVKTPSKSPFPTRPRNHPDICNLHNFNSRALSTHQFMSPPHITSCVLDAPAIAFVSSSVPSASCVQERSSEDVKGSFGGQEKVVNDSKL